MVKFYSSNYTYDFPFPAVSLAYFLRYPNPYSTHVLSTDTITRHYDPSTQRLTTVRLHLKRSKLPSAVLKLLPRGLLGASGSGESQSFILEKSVVDVKEGWMDTESRNLEFTGVLSVVERQQFRRPQLEITGDEWKGVEAAAARHGFNVAGSGAGDNMTEVTSTVTLHSSLGQRMKRRKAEIMDASSTSSAEEDSGEQKMGFFKSWSTASLQRSIELIGLKRAARSQPNAKEGMKVVLERMREGGLVGVLEGMRRDREAILGGHGGVAVKRIRGEDDE